MRALITDSGYFSGALSAARSLKEAGWTVGIGSPKKGFAHRSRAVHRHHFVPSPEFDLDGFVERINRATAEEGYKVVLPTSDLELLALSRERERLNALVPYGSHDSVESALDKLDSTEAAEKAGLRVPETRLATDENIRAIAPDETIVVKARRHSFLDRGSDTSFRAAALCRGPEQVAARVHGVRSEGGEALLQERLRGRLVSLTLLAGPDAHIDATVYQVAERTWPDGVGGTARGFTARPGQRLLDRCASLLSELEWSGLAQVQFLLPDEGEPWFIDFNGRIYGSIALAAAAGVNLPARWADGALGRVPTDPVTAASGVRYQWFEGDLKRAMLSGPRRLPFEVVGSLRYARGAAHAVWSAKDPLPAVWYTNMLIGRLLGKALTRARRAA